MSGPALYCILSPVFGRLFCLAGEKGENLFDAHVIIIVRALRDLSKCHRRWLNVANQLYCAFAVRLAHSEYELSQQLHPNKFMAGTT